MADDHPRLSLAAGAWTDERTTLMLLRFGARPRGREVRTYPPSLCGADGAPVVGPGTNVVFGVAKRAGVRTLSAAFVQDGAVRGGSPPGPPGLADPAVGQRAVVAGGAPDSDAQPPAQRR